MSNQPQVVTEEIELIPHPMDAWRAQLDALIACAPGDETAIAWHLADASRHLPANRSAIDQLRHEATRANGKCLLSESQARSISTRMMAEFALSEVHRHQARENETTGRRAAIPDNPQCLGCNHSPALRRLAGGAVPHAVACPHYTHPGTQRTQAGPVAPSSKGTES